MDKNVTVLKHGSSHPDEIVFHCYSCGCEFSVPRARCWHRPRCKVTVTITGIPEPHYWYKCPECFDECSEKICRDGEG